MKIREIVRYSKRLIKNRRTGVMLICLLPVTVGLLFNFMETSVFSMILYFSDRKPVEIIRDRGLLISAISVTILLMKWIFTAPLKYARAVRLNEICCETRKIYTPVSVILTNSKAVGRSIASEILTKIVSLLAISPAVVTIILAVRSFSDENLSGCIHLLALSFLLILFWLSVKLTMTCVPFLLARDRSKNALSTVFRAFRFTKGRKSLLLRLVIFYTLPSVFLLPLLWTFPEFMSAYALSMSIFFRQDEYRKSDSVAEYKKYKKIEMIKNSIRPVAK